MQIVLKVICTLAFDLKWDMAISSFSSFALLIWAGGTPPLEELRISDSLEFRGTFQVCFNFCTDILLCPHCRQGERLSCALVSTFSG